MIWSCGHEHPTRGEAIRCLHSQPQLIGFTEDARLELGEAGAREALARRLAEIAAADGNGAGGGGR